MRIAIVSPHQQGACSATATSQASNCSNTRPCAYTFAARHSHGKMREIHTCSSRESTQRILLSFLCIPFSVAFTIRTFLSSQTEKSSTEANTHLVKRDCAWTLLSPLQASPQRSSRRERTNKKADTYPRRNRLCIAFSVASASMAHSSVLAKLSLNAGRVSQCTDKNRVRQCTNKSRKGTVG